MLCLYCGNRISLLRKIKDSEFCSVKHRDIYHKEQTKLALARLTEAGNRITQPRRPAEPVEAVVDKQVADTSGEDLNLPSLGGFISEPPAECPPIGPHHPSIEAAWLSVTAIPPRPEAPEAKFTWEPLGYCRPTQAARSGSEKPRLGGGVPQAEFKPVNLQLPVPALALDLDEEACREAQEHTGVAPPVPNPLPSPARPGEAPPRSPVAVMFEAGAPALVSNLELSPVKPSFAGLQVLQPGAASPCADWKAPGMWPEVPYVSVPTLMAGPLQSSGATQILAEPGWRNHVPSLADYMPQPLAACSRDGRAPEAAGAVAGTVLRLLPSSAGLPDAELRRAWCRLQKPGAAAGSTSLFAKGMAFAASQQDQVRLPGVLPPAIPVGMRSLGLHLSMPVAAAEPPAISSEAAGQIPMAVTRRLPQLDWSAATQRLRDEAALSAYMPQPLAACSFDARAPEAPGLAFAASQQDQIRLPGFLAPAIAVEMRSLSGRVSVPLAAAEPLDISIAAGGEIPMAVMGRLPQLTWSAATPRLRAEANVSAYMPQPLAACSSGGRTPEAAGAVAGTVPHLLPSSAGLPDAELRRARCRLPKPGAAAGSTSVFETGLAFAARQQDRIPMPGFFAPAHPVGMPSLGGHLSMPVAAAEPLAISTEAAGQIPVAVTRRLPQLAWSAATHRLRAEAALSAYMPQPLAPCSFDARAPEAAGAVTGTALRVLPASAGLPDAEPRRACCRLSKPGAAVGSTSVFATGLAFAASQQDQIHLPGFLAPAISVGMPSLSGRVSMPLAAADPLDLSTGPGGEIPMAVTRRLPQLAWSAATPQFRAEAALSAWEFATHSLPPQPMVGADQVAPLASRAKGGRKVAATAALPTADLPLLGPRLSCAESLVPLTAPPRSEGAEATGVAPLPEVNTFIPSRRRQEIKARIAMPSVGGFVRYRGMATSVNLQRLGAHLASVEDPRLISSGAARMMEWTPFPSPARPSPKAILGSRGLTVTPASVRLLVRLFSINLTNLTTVAPPVRPIGATAPHTVCRPPRLPSIETAQDGGQAHERTSKLLSAMIERLEGGPTRWMLTRFWRRTPLPLKGLVAGIVLLSALTAIGSQSSGNPLSGLREDIRGRAAVNLVDDFRAGMGAWGGAENWAETWSYDDAGFAQTGDLALYRPSMTLNDYQFEFLGQIAHRGMGWVFRAVDGRNYYAMKIVFTNSGPMPAGVIVRYAVIDGKPGPKTQLPLPMGARPDTMYRIRVDVDGPNFTAQIQDQIVDVWSDSRLAAGGVGFFSDKGERAKIRWIEVTHQSDFLGKLCAYLVPFDTRSTNRSVTR